MSELYIHSPNFFMALHITNTTDLISWTHCQQSHLKCQKCWTKNRNMICDVWDFQDNDYEGYCLLGCDPVYSRRSLITFRRNIPPVSRGHKREGAWCPEFLLLAPQTGHSICPRKSYPSDSETLHIRKSNITLLPWWWRQLNLRSFQMRQQFKGLLTYRGSEEPGNMWSDWNVNSPSHRLH
jgi:hypothetical protein